jgi:hypothetical protein
LAEDRGRSARNGSSAPRSCMETRVPDPHGLYACLRTKPIVASGLEMLSHNTSLSDSIDILVSACSEVSSRIDHSSLQTKRSCVRDNLLRLRWLVTSIKRLRAGSSPWIKPHQPRQPKNHSNTTTAVSICFATEPPHT